MRKETWSEDHKTKTIINIQPGYCTNVISILTGYIDNNELNKSINMSIWDDISFHGYSRDNLDSNTLTFEFDINNPIYFCLDRLLDEDNILVIDDDDSYKTMEKFMLIKREETIIKIMFINTKRNADSHNKFRAFIKNIGPDCRSKISDDITKPRLVNFFKDCVEALLEEFHQITINEYLETKRVESLSLKKKR